MNAPLLPLEDALAHLLSAAVAVSETEQVATGQALKRVLAHGCHASAPVPPHNNSAVDGYALRCSDWQGQALNISQRITAGMAPPPLAPGTAARIFTGGVIPAGADAVVMQEDTRCEGDAVVISQTPTVSQNIRPRGQDLTEGAEVLAAGTRPRPQELGLLASTGLAELAVFRRLRVALLSTGDELVTPGQSLRPGQIFNTNRYTLLGLIQALGLEAIDCGDVRDTRDATESALIAAAREADVIVTTGGVSVGEEDHVRAAIESRGKLDLWRLAIKPGKPLAFGHIAGTPILGLPGNPAAVLVTFLLLARPFLLRMQGVESPLEPTPQLIPAYFSVPNAGVRREYLRVCCRQEASGRNYLEAHPNQNSGMLSSAAWASGLAVIQEGQTVRFGEPVPYLSFAELME